MKKFREFLKGNAGLTNGDAIRIMISTGILLGANLYACAKWRKAEEDKYNYQFKIAMDAINSDIKEHLKSINNSNSEEIAEEFDF